MALKSQEIADMVQLLPEADKEFVYELVKRLLPDDVATAADLAAHAAAMDEFKSGKTMKADEIDWDSPEEKNTNALRRATHKRGVAPSDLQRHSKAFCCAAGKSFTTPCGGLNGRRRPAGGV